MSILDRSLIKIINLERRPDRREKAVKELEKAGIENYEVFKAVDGYAIPPTKEIYRLFKGNDFNYQRGPIGCALSHYKIWQELVASDKDWAVVFEDDIKLYPNFKENLEKVLTGFNEDTGYVLIGYLIFKQVEQKLEQEGFFDKSEPTFVTLANNPGALEIKCYGGGTHGYIITKKGAQTMLDYYKTHPITGHIDMEIVWMQLTKIEIVVPRLVTLEDIQFMWPNTDSDIQINKAMFNFSDLAQEILAEEWEFYPGKDFWGSDITHLQGKEVIELAIEANRIPQCVAFNTLGYLKYKFNPDNLVSNSMINLENGHGTWVKKNHKIPEVTDSEGNVWFFYSHMDIFGSDINYSPNGDYFETANKLDLCTSFNTLGYFKAINDVAALRFKQFGYNGAGRDGIYLLKNMSLANKLEKIKKLELVNVFVNHNAKKWSQDTLDGILTGLNFAIVDSPIEAHVLVNHITDQKICHLKKLNVVISGESWPSDINWDISIGTTKTFNSQKHVWYSQLLQSVSEHRQSINPSHWLKQKSKFCAYMYSNQQSHRQRIFHLILNYKKVDGLGKCCNNQNIEDTRSVYNENETYNDIAVKLYSDYKFVIAMENKLVEGYVTEKLLNPLIAGSIPIYWGPEDIFNIFNKKRVIYINDMSDEEIINRIKELDTDEEKYQEILKEPWFVNNNDDSDINNLNKLLAEAKSQLRLF